MPRYIKTISFVTQGGRFKSEKDDPRVNAILQRLQGEGAEILDLQVRLGGSTFTGLISLYVIEYEAPRPL